MSGSLQVNGLTILVVETASLGDRSYLVHDGEVAFVVDPQRDIDRLLDLLREHQVRLTHVLETHIHNDYLTGGPALWNGHPHGHAIFNGVCCGLFIATYTVADQRAVVFAGVSPLLLDWGGNLARSMLLAPLAWRRRVECRDVWRTYRRECLTVAILGPGAYMLVLWAMTFSPLSSIAPVREVSILIGAYFGARILKEGDAARRLAATFGMAAGVVALALG